MSFYKLDGEAILVAPNFVCSPTFSLLATRKDTYEFPVDGWHWFDSDSEAESFFGVHISTSNELLAELPSLEWLE